MLKLLYFCFLIKACVSESARYDNYRVYELIPTTIEHLQILNEIENSSDSFKFLEYSKLLNRKVVIIVPPHKFADFTDLMELNDFKFNIQQNNLQKLIDEERYRQMKRTTIDFNWDDYHTLDQIYDWLDTLVKKNSDHLASIVVGKSYEGREIRGVKVSYKAGNTGIFVEGGIHAREWISPATVTYILNQLVNSEDKNIRSIAENYDWYIVPVINPDGYHYTFEKDRLWRKTRKPYNAFCFGADPNRNWDIHWSEIGTSKSPCAENFHGGEPFSEIETKSVSEYLLKLKGKLQTYLAFHSYSQLLLFPYGYTSEHVKNHDDLQMIGNKSVTALKIRYGTEYSAGNIYDIIYPVSGSSMEWAYDILQTEIAFTYELRPANNRRSASVGFILSPEEIIPTGEETLDSIVVILTEAKKLGYYNF